MDRLLTGPMCLDIHPEFGAIYRSGEFVQRGAVLGLTLDRLRAAIAPVSGWVRLVSVDADALSLRSVSGLRVEIWPHAHQTTSASTL